MHLYLEDKLKLNVTGKVIVNEIFADGTKKIKKTDENIVVNDGILLLISYLMAGENDQSLSGITHLAVGTGTPLFMDGATEEEKKYFLNGLSGLIEEQLRMVRWGFRYFKRDEYRNIVKADERGNIIEFIYRLRQNEPDEKIYISEIGMFGGHVVVNQSPIAKTIRNEDGTISSDSEVVDGGILFSYKYYDPPIDKFPDTVLEFVWRINIMAA